MNYDAKGKSCQDVLVYGDKAAGQCYKIALGALFPIFFSMQFLQDHP
jgi:hypothetical protein